VAKEIKVVKKKPVGAVSSEVMDYLMGGL